MTDTMPAAALGLPDDAAQSFDRCSFLATLAAAGVMTGAAVPAIAADHPDAALLELVEQLAAAEAKWKDFNREGDVIFPRLDAMTPTIPAELVHQPSRDTFEICYKPKNLPSGLIAGEWMRCYIQDDACIRHLRWAVGVWRKEGTGQDVVERAEEILAAFDAYAPKAKHAEDASGLTAHSERIAINAELIDRLNYEIASLPAVTADGVAAKARAAASAWASDLTYLSTEVLPDMLRGEGMYKRTEILLAVSVVIDAMKLDAAPQVASSDRRVA